MAEGDECSSLVVPATKEAPSVHAGYLRGSEAGGLSSGDNSSSCEMLPTREESGGKEEREYERGERSAEMNARPHTDTWYAPRACTGTCVPCAASVERKFRNDCTDRA